MKINGGRIRDPELRHAALRKAYTTTIVDCLYVVIKIKTAAFRTTSGHHELASFCVFTRCNKVAKIPHEILLARWVSGWTDGFFKYLTKYVSGHIFTWH